MITVLLVRHADIDLPPASADPPLNATGRARAEALARVVGRAGVTAVFTSALTRTKQTVASVGIESRVMPDDVAPRIRAGEFGDVVLIAGHSNTVPEVIAELGVAAPPVIGETEFDNLFVVTVSDDAALLSLKYATEIRGAPCPPAAD
ncbi:phosphoglycerate mutase family protein [Actinoplanes sp. NPDC051513]|uniref:phosphoglycerate mutase family protein n=1 Tax=Actinoplanes sp. NPDC051513 TaxID=3363908 RepID=UPI0037A8941C